MSRAMLSDNLARTAAPTRAHSDGMDDQHMRVERKKDQRPERQLELCNEGRILMTHGIE